MLLLTRRTLKVKDDDQLIHEYRTHGHKLIIEEIYSRYGHLVFGVAMKYLQNKEDAEDLTMQVFGNLGDKLTRNDIRFFKGWLYQVVKNECLMILRRKKQTVPIDLVNSISEEPLETDDQTEFNIALLNESIEQLSPIQKNCIILFFQHEMSYKKIADELKLDLNKVKSAIQNGKRNIKIYLEEHATRTIK